MTTELVRDTEAHVARVAGGITAPDERECVLCYVDRMLEAFGCDNTLRWARRWRDQVAPGATGLEQQLRRRGGYCDCEALCNGYAATWPGAEDDEAPTPRPACHGVGRAGSTRPCRNWEPMARG